MRAFFNVLLYWRIFKSYFCLDFFLILFNVIILLYKSNLIHFLLQLFDKLKVQETVALSAVEKSELHSSSSHLTDQTRRTDPKHTQERSEHSEKDKTTLKATHKSETKPKVEYGRVHTRHVNQLFIRGENVLLVNIHQD